MMDHVVMSSRKAPPTEVTIATKPVWTSGIVVTPGWSPVLEVTIATRLLRTGDMLTDLTPITAGTMATNHVLATPGVATKEATKIGEITKAAKFRRNSGITTERN